MAAHPLLTPDDISRILQDAVEAFTDDDTIYNAVQTLADAEDFCEHLAMAFHKAEG